MDKNMKNKDNKKKSILETILETIFSFPPIQGIAFGCMLTGLFDEIKLCKKYGIVKTLLEDYEDVFFSTSTDMYIFLISSLLITLIIYIYNINAKKKETKNIMDYSNTQNNESIEKRDFTVFDNIVQSVQKNEELIEEGLYEILEEQNEEVNKEKNDIRFEGQNEDLKEQDEKLKEQNKEQNEENNSNFNFNEDFMDCLKYKTSSELKTYLSNFKQSFQEQVINEIDAKKESDDNPYSELFSTFQTNITQALMEKDYISEDKAKEINAIYRNVRYDILDEIKKKILNASSYKDYIFYTNIYIQIGKTKDEIIPVYKINFTNPFYYRILRKTSWEKMIEARNSPNYNCEYNTPYFDYEITLYINYLYNFEDNNKEESPLSLSEWIKNEEREREWKKTKKEIDERLQKERLENERKTNYAATLINNNNTYNGGKSYNMDTPRIRCASCGGKGFFILMILMVIKNAIFVQIAMVLVI